MNWNLSDYQWTLLIAAIIPFFLGMIAAFRAVKAKRATNTATSAPEFCLLFMGIALGLWIAVGIGYILVFLGKTNG